jgi:hypothetical protein
MSDTNKQFIFIKDTYINKYQILSITPLEYRKSSCFTVFFSDGGIRRPVRFDVCKETDPATYKTLADMTGHLSPMDR